MGYNEGVVKKYRNDPPYPIKDKMQVLGLDIVESQSSLFITSLEEVMSSKNLFDCSYQIPLVVGCGPGI